MSVCNWKFSDFWQRNFYCLLCVWGSQSKQNFTLIWTDHKHNCIIYGNREAIQFWDHCWPEKRSRCQIVSCNESFFSGYSYFPFYFHSFLLIDGRVYGEQFRPCHFFFIVSKLPFQIWFLSHSTSIVKGASKFNDHLCFCIIRNS